MARPAWMPGFFSGGKNGISLGFLWDLHGISMGFLWDVHGISMGLDSYGGFQSMGVSQNRWFMRENPFQTDGLRKPYFRTAPYNGNMMGIPCTAMFMVDVWNI